MLIFNEGLPGGGKSFDAMATHILPALKQRRKVYARLNGLGDPVIRSRIAEYCGLTKSDIDDLLFHVSSIDVRSRFVAISDADGELVMPPEFIDALVVIDEVHEFYGQDQKNRPSQQVEQFFAIHRHYGMDIVVLSQWYKRLSTVIRARVERKYVFQKLTAVGLESFYTRTEYQALAPDKFVKKAVEKKKYDKKIFDLYRGVISDDTNTEVYKAGSSTIWKKLLPMILIAVVVMGFAYYGFTRFFHPKKPAQQTAQAFQSNLPSGVFQPSSVDALAKSHAPAVPQSQVAQAAAAVSEPPPKPDVTDKMTPSQKYVWKLFDKGRARVIGSITDSRGAHAWIEWRQETSDPFEQLSVEQLRSMGIQATVEPYGVRLVAANETKIATAWPVKIVRPEDPTLYRLDGGPGVAGGASAASTPATPGTAFASALVDLSKGVGNGHVDKANTSPMR